MSANNPTVGMKFGSYDESLKQAKENSTYMERNKNNVSIYTQENGEKQQFKNNGHAAYMWNTQEDGSQLFFRGNVSYTLSPDGMTEKNNFTEIWGDTKYAVDKNGNGVVDKDEIFDING